MNFIDFIEKFSTEKAVIDHFLKIRYKGKVKCNHCQSEKVYQRSKNLKIFDCNECGNTFSPFKDTIFEKTSTDLRKWMYAIHLFLNGKKGISGLQLKREIKVTYKTAWRMLHKIREAMGNGSHEKFAETVVEMDEAYVGGKPKKSKDDDDNNKRGRGTKKTPIVGIADRESGKVFAEVAVSNKHGKKLSGNQLLSILDKTVEGDSIIVTDKFSGYNIFKNTDHLHLTLDHTKGYSNGDIYVNNIESFWAILKRGVYGIYHHISIEYLQNYIDEFCFRFNNRKNGDMFDVVLQQAVL
jgi:transposase-like protein